MPALILQQVLQVLVEESLVEAVGLEWRGIQGIALPSEAPSHLALRNHALLLHRAQSDQAASKLASTTSSLSGVWCCLWLLPCNNVCRRHHSECRVMCMARQPLWIRLISECATHKHENGSELRQALLLQAPTTLQMFDRCHRQTHAEQQTPVYLAIRHAEVCPELILESGATLAVIWIADTPGSEQTSVQTSGWPRCLTGPQQPCWEIFGDWGDQALDQADHRRCAGPVQATPIKHVAAS